MMMKKSAYSDNKAGKCARSIFHTAKILFSKGREKVHITCSKVMKTVKKGYSKISEKVLRPAMNAVRNAGKVLKVRVAPILLSAIVGLSLFGTTATSVSAAATIYRQNVSKSAVSCNASNGSLPTSLTSVDGNTCYYFNYQGTEKVKTAKLYIMYPGDSSYSCVYTTTATNYLRYAYCKIDVGSRGGSLKFYWRLTLTNGSSKTLSKTSVTVKNVINQNISTNSVSSNATDGSLPSGTTSLTGGSSSYYVNVQVSDDQKIAKAQLYVMQPGESSYTNVYTKTASNYVRYVGKKITVANKSGSFRYFWKLTMTDGTVKSTSKETASVTASSTSLPTNLYLTQAGSTTCTLCAATMMLRATMYVNGSSSWSIITEAKLKSTAWVNGSGLRTSFTYTATNGSAFTVKKKSYSSGISLSSLKSLLDSHPEGFVLYCSGMPHAVFVTRYSGDTVYCADPASSYSGKEIKLSASSLGKNYGSQSKVLAKVTGIWYVSSYTVK